LAKVLTYSVKTYEKRITNERDKKNPNNESMQNNNVVEVTYLQEFVCCIAEEYQRPQEEHPQG